MCVVTPRVIIFAKCTTTTYMGDHDHKRKKGKDKRKDTFKLFGKNTARGLRHKLECMEHSSAASKIPSEGKTKSSQDSSKTSMTSGK